MSTIKSPPKLHLQKPFLKWVGGKTQLLDRLVKHIPEQIKNYHEPFLGGGSVLFAVLSLQKSDQVRRITITEKIYASDANKYLIMVFKHIQNKVIPSPLRPKFRNKSETNIYFLSKKKISNEKKLAIIKITKILTSIIIIGFIGYFISN